MWNSQMVDWSGGNKEQSIKYNRLIKIEKGRVT